MFNVEKKRKKKPAVRLLGAGDIEAALERIKGAFPEDDAGDPLAKVAYRCVYAGACAMADEIVRGGRSDEEYREMRGDVDWITDATVLEQLLDGKLGAVAFIREEIG